MFFQKLYERLIQDARKTSSDERLRNQIQFRWLLKILFALVLLFSVMNLILGEYLMTALLLGLAASFFGFYWLVYLLKDSGVFIVTVLLNAEVIIFVLYLLLSGASMGTAVVWLVILPPLSIILTGPRAGTATSLSFFLILIFFMWTEFGRNLLGYEHYSPIFYSRFPLIFLTLYVIAMFTDTLRRNTVRELNQSIEKIGETYQYQYSSLKERISEAKRIRHDMRHHFVILDHYLEDGMIEEAKEYIEKYYNAIPYEEALTYCHHYGTNALLTYFTELAGKHQIPHEIRVDFPEKLPVSDEDLTVILGNLLENAMDACRDAVNEKPDFEPYIKIAGNYDGQMILIAVENSALHEAKIDKKQRYLSTKHKGHGIGIDSIRTVAEKNNGFLKIEQANGKFIANVMMM